MRSTVRTFLTTFGCGALALAGVAAAAEPYLVRGQIVSAGGPIAGAEVRLIHRPEPRWAPPGGAAEVPAAEEIAVTPDAKGRFEIAVDLGEVFDDPHAPPAGSARWILEVSAPGWASAVVEVPASRYSSTPRTGVRPGAVLELGGIRLERGIRVAGRIIDGGAAAGAPVAGARVALWPEMVAVPEPWTASSDREGRFALADVPPGTYVVTFDRPGFVPGSLGSVSVRARDAVDLGTLELERPVTVSGRVVDGSGKPLAGVEVRYSHALSGVGTVARDWLPEPTAETGAGGEFALSGLPPEPGRHFRLDKEGYRGWIRRFELEPAAEDLRFTFPIVLTEDRVVDGRVVEPTGEPVAGVEVQWASEAGSSSAATDREGRFELEVFEDRPTVYLNAPGYAMKSVTLATRSVFSESPADPETIVLEPIDVVDVELGVRDSEGGPVAGAEVRAARQGKGPVFYLRQLVTGPSGEATLDRIPVADRFSIQIDHPEYPRYWRDDVEIVAGQKYLEVTLEPAWRLATVSGRVIDAGGEPARGATVGLTRVDRTLPSYETRADASGLFELDRVREGAYLLTAEAPGHARAKVPLRVSPGVGPTTVTLAPGVALYGTVRGRPQGEDARARLRVRASSELRVREAEIDGDRYRFEDLDPGTWTVVAGIAGVEVTEEVAIAPGETEVRFDLELPVTFRVRGSLHVDGAPLGHAGVSLQSVPGAPHAHHWGTTDGGGRFAFDHVVPGAYELRHFGELGSLRRPLAVDGDAELGLEMRTTHLRGRVVDRTTGLGLAEVPVEASPEIHMSHGPSFDAVTDAAGEFSIGPVLEGPWSIFVRSPGYVEDRRQVDLPVASPALVELQPTAGLRVRVETASGRMPSFVGLRLRDAGGQDVARHGLTLTGPEGHWAGAPPGSYRLFAHDSFTTLATDVEIPGPAVTLRFPAAGNLSIRVPELELEPDPPNRHPQTPVQVELNLEAPADPAFDGTRVRRGRNLHFDGLAPGLWRVEVRTGDDRAWIGTAEVVDGQRREVYLSSD